MCVGCVIVIKPEVPTLEPVKQQLQSLFFHKDTSICSESNLKSSVSCLLFCMNHM